MSNPTLPERQASKAKDKYLVPSVYLSTNAKSNSYSYLMNLRTSLQYFGYSQVNGTNIDAQFNNTFMVNGWLAF
ncbi:MAG: hypothetical protein PHD43_07015 [Methylococcales bacterium]|nr:hypothetical protein [Methylococcales bacterium]